MSRRIAGLHRWLIEFVFGVVRSPKRTLGLCLLGVAAAAALAWYRLDISTDQDQLFSSNVPFFRDYLSFTANFPENQAGYVVIQAKDADHPPPAARWAAVADAVAERLAADKENVRLVEGHTDVSQIGRQALVWDVDDPNEVVRAAQQAREQLVPLATLWGSLPDARLAWFGRRTPIHRVLYGLAHAPPDKLDAQLAEFVGLVSQSWNRMIDQPQTPVRVGGLVPDLANLQVQTPRELGYAYIPDPQNPARHLLLVQVFEQNKLSSFDGLVRVIAGIRRDIAAAAEPFAAEFTVGLSGRPALDADELSTTDKDSRRAEIVSLTAVFVGLALFLRSVWLAIAAELALGVGIGWTFGWATLSTAAYNGRTRGDLNLLSTVFLIALIGIGMDYLIQVLTRFRQEAVRYAADPGRDPRSIWAGVFKHVSAPINTACAGAAGAFLVSVFTPFRGAAELGLIAGGGLLLCLVTCYVVLPALLTVFPAKVRPTPAERAVALGHVEPPPANGRHRHWRLALPAAWAALLLAGIPFMRRTAFDPGLLTLQNPDLSSVKLVRKLPTWFDAELSTDLTVLRQVRLAVEQLPVVDHTESVLQAFDNYQFLHANPLPKIDWVTINPVTVGDLDGIAASADSLADRLAAAVATDRQPFTAAAVQLRGFAARLRFNATAADRQLMAGRLALWQQAFIGELHALLAPFDPDPPNIATAPPALRSHLLGLDGRYALYVYPKADLWKQPDLAAFVTRVEGSVAKLGNGIPPITGVASDVFHSTDQTHAAFRDATLYALGLIFLLVLLDLRDLRQTFLAISVLALGLPMLVAVMGVLGVNWNFANFFGLPILIGAGHEYGVFMVHRYNEACRDPHRPWRKWDVSDRALLLCGYVTSISFGFFWLFGHHLGLKSLGLVMALGIACIYLATLCVLRPLLLWKLARREPAPHPADPLPGGLLAGRA